MKLTLVQILVSIQWLCLVQAEDSLLPNHVPELIRLDQQFQTAVEKQKKLTVEPVIKLIGFYKQKMSSLQERYQDAGDLKRAVAAKDAAESEPIKAKVHEDFDEIASVQLIFLKEKQKIIDENIKGIKVITVKYLKALNELKLKLTKSGNLKGALQVNERITSVSNESKFSIPEVKPNNEVASSLRPNPNRDFVWRVVGQKIEIQKYIGNSQKVVIPRSIEGKPVEILGKSIFNDCHDVESIIMPDSVVKIGEGAFMSCGIKNIVIPDSVTEIGDYTFSGPNLESVKLSKNLKELPGYFLQNCFNLKELFIPEGIKKIPRKFIYRTNLEELILPNSIVEIDSLALVKCKFEILKIPQSVKRIGEKAFLDTEVKAVIIEGQPPKIDEGDPFGDQNFDITLYRYSDTLGWKEKWCGRDVNVINR